MAESTQQLANDAGNDAWNDARVVVITGASGGIGAALAHALGEAGDCLVLAARREAELEGVALEAQSRGAAGTLTVQTDVTQRDDVNRLRDAALEMFGRIDVWVNNAGQGISRRVLDLTDEDVDAIIAVNVKSVLYGAQAVVPYFVQRGQGHLINVSSFLGRVPLAPIRSVYSAAKAAVNSLTANLRMELHDEAPNVHVSLVMPGVVTTDFARNVRGDANARPPHLTGQPPRPGTARMPTQTPAEVAGIIAELIQHPKPEVYTNPASPAVARAYYEDVGAFEARMAAH